jgi:hypothetical protein
MTLADVERLKQMAREQILDLRASLLPYTHGAASEPPVR